MSKDQTTRLVVSGAAVVAGVILLTRKGTTAPPAPPPGMATVRVAVRNTSGGSVAGATIVLDGATGTTGSSGILDLASITPGPYTLSGAAQGYQPAMQSVTVAEGTNLFTITLSLVAPDVVHATIAITNYPANSFDYDIGYGPDGSIQMLETGIRVSQQAAIYGPASGMLLVRVHDESGAVVHENTITVTIKEGGYYLYDCGTGALTGQERPWTVLSETIPAQIPFAGYFLPKATLKLKKGNGMLYRIQHSVSGHSFMNWSFLPTDLIGQSQAPQAYLPLDAPDDIYNIAGCKSVYTNDSELCTLGPLVPPGRYTVYADMFWARVIYDPSIGDVHTVIPYFTESLGAIAQVDVIIADNFVLQNPRVPASAVRGDTVTVSIDIANIGVEPGSAYLSWVVVAGSVGEIVDSGESVILGPGEHTTKLLTFTIPVTEYHGTGACDVTWRIDRFNQRIRSRITTTFS